MPSLPAVCSLQLCVLLGAVISFIIIIIIIIIIMFIRL